MTSVVVRCYNLLCLILSRLYRGAHARTHYANLAARTYCIDHVFWHLADHNYHFIDRDNLSFSLHSSSAKVLSPQS